MLRELAEVLEALAAAHPLVLVLEDLHWSDPSTVAALALLARRREAARLLVLGTYRPVELLLQEHPLKTVKQELATHGQCVELALGGLSPPAVAAYVAQRRDTPAGHEALAAWVSQRTEGHPLFMVQLVDYLAQQHLLQAPGPAGAARPTGPPLAQVVPPGLQALLEAQVGRLRPAAQQMLEAGSVAGVEFVGARVAAGLQMAPAAVEAVGEQLARQGQFLEERGLVAWPDGTVSGCYGFRHALYQEAVYKRLGAERQARWHRVMGERLEQAYGERTPEVAAELALHFQRGPDARRAVQYLGQAADTAAQRYAYPEVVALLTRGVELLATLPETPARAQQELALLLALGPALRATKGQAAPEVEQTYARARTLCTQVGETPQRFPTRWRLCEFYRTRGALQTARELGEQLYQRAQRAPASPLRLEAHARLGTILFFLGDYAAARTHFAQGIARTDPLAQRAQVLHQGEAPGLRCLALVAWTLWCLGYPVQAVRRSQEALRLAQALAHPYSLTQAQHIAALLHHRLREAPAVQAQALLTLATAQGCALHVGYGTCLRGWALAMQGQGAAGLAQLHQGLAAVVATGQELTRPLCLVLLAEAMGQVGQVAAGLRLLVEARTVLEASGRGDLLAEAYRLQGAFLLRQPRPHTAQAEACLQQALSIARRQQAKSWELRAATSLARLWQQQGKRAEAFELLAPIYGWFTEGFDTADLQEAKALLEVLA